MARKQACSEIAVTFQAMADEIQFVCDLAQTSDVAPVDLARHRHAMGGASIDQRAASGEIQVRILPDWIPPFSHRNHTAPIVVEVRFLFATLGIPKRDARKERERARSARKRDIRASTINVAKLPKHEVMRRRAEEPDDGLRRLPLHRDECRDDERPCPFVSCRFHLFLDVDPYRGSIKLNFPDLLDDDGTPRLEQMLETCALDVTDRGGVTLDALAEIMNLTRERVRQLELEVLQKYESLKR
jgi:hypothetical protein